MKQKLLIIEDEVMLGKQLKWASAAQARHVVILGREYLENRQVVVKDMQTGEQKPVKLDLFLSDYLLR